jgi:hypothetical protein
MYLEDNLSKQINEYGKVSGLGDKYDYIDKIILYYQKNEYISEARDRCLHYWIWNRNLLDVMLLKPFEDIFN